MVHGGAWVADGGAVELPALRLAHPSTPFRPKPTATMHGFAPHFLCLSPPLQPPPEKSVAGAIRTLQEVGALTPAEELTPLGEHPGFEGGAGRACDNGQAPLAAACIRKTSLHLSLLV